MSGVPESLFISHLVPKVDIENAAEDILHGSYWNVRDSQFPGYWSLDIGADDNLTTTDVLDHFQIRTGVRPLLELEVDALFDPATGERL